MKQSLKIDFYDDFRCIADQCSLCCCSGWDISVDSDTCSRWENDEAQKEYLAKNLIVKKNKRKAEASIRMGTDKSCPFLNDKGLCKVYISNGEDYQPKTCRIFPRIENSMGKWEEYSLSCACPEVVDKLKKSNKKISFLYEGDDRDLDQVPIEYNIRSNIISIIQNDHYSLSDRILLSFYMLLEIKMEPDQAIEIIRKFEADDYRKALVKQFRDIDIDTKETLRETNELFLDIVMNYRKEKYYKNYLQKIYAEAEMLDVEGRQNLHYVEAFNKEFEVFDKLLENCMVTKIFANCNSEDIDEMLLAFQIVVTQYLMIRHSAYLKSLVNTKETNQNRAEKKECDAGPNSLHPIENKYDELRNYIVIYSRIIEYNQDGIREFWKDSFDEAIWEFGYMMLLIA